MRRAASVTFSVGEGGYWQVPAQSSMLSPFLSPRRGYPRSPPGSCPRNPGNPMTKLRRNQHLRTAGAGPASHPQRCRRPRVSNSRGGCLPRSAAVQSVLIDSCRSGPPRHGKRGVARQGKAMSSTPRGRRAGDLSRRLAISISSQRRPNTRSTTKRR